MLKNSGQEINSNGSPDDDIWAERSEYWRTYEPKKRAGKKKFHFREPLILCGHGIRLRVECGTLLIRNGLTHYPQKSEEIRFFPGDPNLPDRIIISDGNGGISLDAINWMSEQEIEFVQLNWRGEVSTIAGKQGYSADPRLVEAQRSIAGTSRAIEIVRWLIREKMTASLETLENAVPKSENGDAAIFRVRKWISQIENPRTAISVPKILGIEGAAAAAYFAAWHGIPLKWTGGKRKPIPESWREIGPRTMGWRKHGNNARHPVNAMLNYGYGVLRSKIRSEIAAAGFDPSIGLMHGNGKNPLPLVYDLMEPLRPVVDAKVLTFARVQTFSPGDFTINTSGACRLNPQMARTLLLAADVNGSARRMIRQVCDVAF